MVKSPVFVVGSARSGTSLVYSILMSSGLYALYEAETLLLRTCAGKYGRLSRQANYEKFMRDWLNSKQFERSGLDKKVFVDNAQQHRSSYLEFLDFFMKSVAKNQGKEAWVENTPNHVLEMKKISTYFNDARFIHVIRDGRAVAASLCKLGWVSQKQPRFRALSAGIHWQDQVLTGRRLGQTLGDKYLEIYYENLVCNPIDELKRISSFIGVEINLETLKDRKWVGGRKNNSVYRDNLDQKTLFVKSGLLSWKTSLTAVEQKILNSVLDKTLHELGYEEGEKTSIGKLSVYYCTWFYFLKKWLRHRTILGRKSKTGLELNV
jgi:hypothetical protein